jgi:Asp-tRNA(Asn)/Glu-tRNA(Gln) amidotransferase A subunit family amidase
VEGPLARTVSDIALMLDVISGLMVKPDLFL